MGRRGVTRGDVVMRCACIFLTALIAVIAGDARAVDSSSAAPPLTFPLLSTVTFGHASSPSTSLGRYPSTRNHTQNTSLRTETELITALAIASFCS